MGFKEHLIRERKARGFSQEELAAQIGVSRQAVSKWETGDALPELSKLVALAEVLNISMDELCGRNILSKSSMFEKEAARGKPTLLRRIAYFALIVLLLAGSFFAGTQFRGVQEPEGDTAPYLPENFSLSGESFSVDDGGLSYRFIPSITGDEYTYRITFTGQDNSPQTFVAPYSGGVCAGTVALSEYDTYSVVVMVSSGQYSRAAMLASDLSFSGSSSYVQWTPVKDQ